MLLHHLKYVSVIAMMLLLFACGGEEKKEEQVVRPVRYQEVGIVETGTVRTFSGTAQTEKSINLSFRSNGIITQFNIELGQKVSQGQLLAQLDNVQARLSYETALTSLNSAQSQMNTAKLSLDRVRTLYEKGSVSLSDFEAAKNSYKTAQQSYESAQKSVAIQKEQINYGALYAPLSGIIASVSAEINENVSPGQTIAVLNAGQSMEISLGIPESVINEVKRDLEVNISFSALSNKKFKGVVSEVSPSLDANSATYPVRIRLISPSDEIKSGMAANVTFNFGDETAPTQNQKKILIPASAVGEDSQGRFVFLIEEKNAKAFVKKQVINVGQITADGFEVESGLKVGQKIATSGLQTLLDGQEVRL